MVEEADPESLLDILVHSFLVLVVPVPGVEEDWGTSVQNTCSFEIQDESTKLKSNKLSKI